MTGEYWRSYALSLGDENFINDRVYHPISPAALSLIMQDGGCNALMLGVLCRDEIVRNPLIIMDDEMLQQITSDNIDGNIAWGEWMMHLLDCFKDLSNNLLYIPARDRVWTTSVFPLLVFDIQPDRQYRHDIDDRIAIAKQRYINHGNRKDNDQG